MTAATVVIPATVPDASAPAGHDEAMVKRFEDGQAAAARGEAYKAPEGDAAPVTPAAPAAETPKAPEPSTPPAPAGDAPAAPKGDFVDNLLTSAGLTRDGITQEFAQGGLSEETYAALEKQGVNRTAVDQYMAGVSAQVERAQAAYGAEVLSAAKVDTATFGKVAEWAKESLTAAELDAYNATVNGGDVAAAALAVAGLHARFTAANPAEPSLMQRDVTPAGGSAAYQSWAQVKADMKRPEYDKDPAFREQVKARLAASGSLS